MKRKSVKNLVTCGGFRMLLTAGAAVVALTWLAGCGDSGNSNVNLLVNSDMETADPISEGYAEGWKLYVENFNPPNNYLISHTDSAAASGTKSVLMRVNTIDANNEYGYFYQDIPVGSFAGKNRAALRCKVKTQGLAGRGFEVAVYFFDSFGGVRAYSSYSETRLVSGTNDWAEYGANISPLPANFSFARVVLAVAPNTTGKVYFDDCYLTAN